MMFGYIYIVFLLFFVSPVSATNFYVGLNYGSTAQSGEVNIIDTNPPTGSTGDPVDYQVPDDTSTTKSLYVGYKLGSDIALELGVSRGDIIASGRIRTPDPDTGEAFFAIGEATEFRYTYIAFVGLWPISNRWAFSTRVGFSVWEFAYAQAEQFVNPADPTVFDPQTRVLTDNTSATLVGVGISFGVTKNIELKLNAENHFVDFSFTNLELDYTAITYTLGAAYHF